MKKIDLHIHTVATNRDSPFTFSLETLKRYVRTANLDAIAITNHNAFDAMQFIAIRDSLPIPVFPGVEIDLDDGHILLVSDGSNISEFESRCSQVRGSQIHNRINVSRLKQIYGDLENYLLIPHSDKNPSIQARTLVELAPHIAAGEVDSAKKFMRAINDPAKPTPVLFSDMRAREDLGALPTRQTYLDCGEVTLRAIAASLGDKRKVSLSEKEGNRLYQVFDDGQRISTGLNVLLGDRSTGKTYTLERMNEVCGQVKYIKQFSLVQQDEGAYDGEFKNDIERRRSVIVDKYLAPFKGVLEDAMKVDLDGNDRAVDKYISSLLKSAQEADRQDSFSKVVLFGETLFPERNDKVLKDLIASVIQVIENVEHREIVERHVDKRALKRLACELIELLWTKRREEKKKRIVNDLIKEIKAGLRIRSSATQVEDVDLYRVRIESRKAARFSEIVKCLQKEAVIFEESIQGFRVVARKCKFTTATQLQAVSTVRTALSKPLKVYDDPYRYLKALMSDDNLAKADLYRFFTRIEYQILNRHGCPVSGGERSEFRLLQEIKDAQNFDILLVDEPESSFDNMFLESDVNEVIKEISKSMPVVVVTHNNTVGASIGADYLLYARKTVEAGEATFTIYSGHPTDKTLKSTDGKCVATHEVLLNSLEAGAEPYSERGRFYAATKD
jgi:hypothetical protein